jgi:AraC-like DNA-binding protein
MVLKKALPFKIPKTTGSSLILQEDLEPFFYDKLHQHEEFQFTIIVSGTGTIIHGDYVGVFEAGDLFLIGSNVPHVFRCDEPYYLKKDKMAHAKTIFFNQEQIAALLTNFHEFEVLAKFLEAASLGGRAIEAGKMALGQQFLGLFSLPPFERVLAFLKFVQVVAKSEQWKSLSRQSARHVREKEGKRLDDIISYTFSNYQKPITLAQIADIANMNISSFCRYFKQHTRRSYVDFLNEYRIQKACGLLSDPNCSIAQVAFEVGYTNLSNFNRQFRRLMKGTPSQYRKRYGQSYSR